MGLADNSYLARLQLRLVIIYIFSYRLTELIKLPNAAFLSLSLST